jgi:hypothetical protein
MSNAQAEMDTAIAAWLHSHKAYTTYLADTEALFRIFASAWRGSPRALSEAFTTFCEALLTKNGYSQAKVKGFYSGRQPNAN